MSIGDAESAALRENAQRLRTVGVGRSIYAR